MAQDIALALKIEHCLCFKHAWL